MKFLFRKVESKEKKELLFKSVIDNDGDFTISASIDGDVWHDICCFDSEDGSLILAANLPEHLGLMLDARGQIVTF